MAFYLVQAFGSLNGSFAWSNNAVVSSSGTEAAVAAAFDAAYRDIFTNATFKAYIPTTVEITQTQASTASAVFKQTTKTVTVSTTAGDSSDPAIDYRAASIITFRTAYATKWGRGRWYFPPLATNALAADGFTMLAAAQTAFVDAMDAYFTAVGSTYEHVILHRKATIDGDRAAYSTDVVTACDIPDSFASQRRRADKRVPTRATVTV